MPKFNFTCAARAAVTGLGAGDVVVAVFGRAVGIVQAHGVGGFHVWYQPSGEATFIAVERAAAVLRLGYLYSICFILRWRWDCYFFPTLRSVCYSFWFAFWRG